jgi:hypothetical protein
MPSSKHDTGSLSPKEQFERTGLYQGGFTIELTPDAELESLQRERVKGMKIEGNTITFENGTLQQIMGGIHFSTEGLKPQGFGYQVMRRIVDANGEYLWENDEVEKMEKGE